MSLLLPTSDQLLRQIAWVLADLGISILLGVVWFTVDTWAARMGWGEQK